MKSDMRAQLTEGSEKIVERVLYQLISHKYPDRNNILNPS